MLGRLWVTTTIRFEMNDDSKLHLLEDKKKKTLVDRRAGIQNRDVSNMKYEW